MTRGKKTARASTEGVYGAGPMGYGGKGADANDSPRPVPLNAAIPSLPMGGYSPAYPVRPPPFDQYLCVESFPTVDVDDTTLTQHILNRNQEITPTAAEQTAIQNLITKIKGVLEKIVVAPDSFTPVAIEEAREVGSFKKGTMLAKNNIADIVVILKSLPTVESVNALGQKIVQELKADQKEVYGCVARDYGVEIAGTQAVVRLLITILPTNAKLLEPDLHLSEKILQSNMATIRHSRWFEEHATHSSVKVLIRIIKDVKKRFDGFKSLNAWSIELLCHYCVMHTRNNVPLPLAGAFKRFFQILATGLLLPGSPALIDPCDPHIRINFSLSLEDMDNICSISQTLLRVIIHGGAEQILGVDNKTVTNVANELSVWNNVVVTPLEKAYSAADMEPYYGPEPKAELEVEQMVAV